MRVYRRRVGQDREREVVCDDGDAVRGRCFAWGVGIGLEGVGLKVWGSGSGVVSDDADGVRERGFASDRGVGVESLGWEVWEFGCECGGWVSGFGVWNLGSVIWCCVFRV